MVFNHPRRLQGRHGWVGGSPEAPPRAGASWGWRPRRRGLCSPGSGPCCPLLSLSLPRLSTIHCLSRGGGSCVLSHLLKITDLQTLRVLNLNTSVLGAGDGHPAHFGLLLSSVLRLPSATTSVLPCFESPWRRGGGVSEARGGA